MRGIQANHQLLKWSFNGETGQPTTRVPLNTIFTLSVILCTPAFLIGISLYVLSVNLFSGISR